MAGTATAAGARSIAPIACVIFADTAGTPPAGVAVRAGTPPAGVAVRFAVGAPAGGVARLGGAGDRSSAPIPCVIFALTTGAPPMGVVALTAGTPPTGVAVDRGAASGVARGGDAGAAPAGVRSIRPIACVCVRAPPTDGGVPVVGVPPAGVAVAFGGAAVGVPPEGVDNPPSAAAVFAPALVGVPPAGVAAWLAAVGLPPAGVAA